MDAQKVFTEYFQDATVGSNLEDYNNWYVSLKETEALGVSPIIDGEILFFDNYVGSDTGYCVLLDSLIGFTDDTKRISTRVVELEGDTLRPVIGGKMYAAFIVSVMPFSKNSWRDFFTWEGSTGSNWSRGRVFAKPVNDRQDLQFSVSTNSSSGGDLDLAASEVIAGGIEVYHLLVVVHESIEGEANDMIHLYVNPDPTKPEAEQTGTKLTGVDTPSNDYSEGTEIKINVRQRGVGARVGGIRVGRTWEAVVMGEEEDPGTRVNKVHASSSDIRAYRNEIITSGPGSVQVFDISGRNVLNHITSGRIETSLKSGIYIVRFEDNNGKVVTGKISLNAE